jgi:hypothetical protein
VEEKESGEDKRMNAAKTRTGKQLEETFNERRKVGKQEAKTDRSASD